jgi:hypothetical protein
METILIIVHAQNSSEEIWRLVDALLNQQLMKHNGMKLMMLQRQSSMFRCQINERRNLEFRLYRNAMVSKPPVANAL